MLFSTNIFLFAFLPICLVGYYLLLKKRKARNYWLLILSLLFYAFGGVGYLFIMLGSIVVNWIFALWVQKETDESKRKWILSGAVLANLSVLFVFKYLIFTVTNINSLFGSDWYVPQIVLPIGISFFTFQAMSYVIDVYRGHGYALKSPYDVGLYISLFPQLVAGPIVRFEDFAGQIDNRRECFNDFSDGVQRFIYGLGKKVLLADTIAVVAKTAFAEAEPSLATAWLGAAAFTLQIYFDFSGYSDMAIGLGKMFGFHFKENFNYPYISTSVSEFWRRWHISMGSWFRDYVYIPLGGNRTGRARVWLNLLVVWFVTGLWHGANWTFIMWGLLQFVAIGVEKVTNAGKSYSVVSKCFGFSYTMLFVVLGWVFFNSPSISEGFAYVSSMFYNPVLCDDVSYLLLRENCLFVVIGILLCAPTIPNLMAAWYERSPWIKSVVVAAVFILSVIYVAKGSYSPFIYFNF